MKLHPQFVIDERGEKKSVLLPVEDYECILEAIEDQLDAADLDEAIQQEKEVVPYEQVRRQLSQ